MTTEDLRNKFKEQTGINWENSQKEPDIDYVMWLEKQVIACEPLIPLPPSLSKEAQEEHDLLKAKIAWQSNNKISAMSMVKEVFSNLSALEVKAYCEKHFS